VSGLNRALDRTARRTFFLPREPQIQLSLFHLLISIPMVQSVYCVDAPVIACQSLIAWLKLQSEAIKTPTHPALGLYRFPSSSPSFDVLLDHFRHFFKPFQSKMPNVQKILQ
jgi:hypothetical protein